MSKTKIKICGIFRIEDAGFVNEAMPDFAGFVFFPKSHRNVTLEMTYELKQKLNPKIKTVGVFVDANPEYIKMLYNKGLIDVIQLHGNEDNDYINNIKTACNNTQVWKAIKITEEADMQKAETCTADRIILDNGYGTGSCFNWENAKKFKENMILAGGLTPENIKSAIEKFHPYAIDLSTGVETEKLKDRDKIFAAVEAVRDN